VGLMGGNNGNAQFLGLAYWSNAKIFLQSFFMLMTIQPFFLASS
jgi:hypothetical protein